MRYMYHRGKNKKRIRNKNQNECDMAILVNDKGEIIDYKSG